MIRRCAAGSAAAAATLALFALLAACGSDAPSSSSPAAYAADARFGDEWLRLIEEARAEGEVVIALGGSRTRENREVFELFTDKFGVAVVGTPGTGTTNVQRLLAERARGRFTADMIIMSANSANRLRGADALVPLEPLFIHPEVSDRSSGWMHTHHVWVGDTPGYMAALQLLVRSNISNLWFNSEKVSLAEIESIRSWQDLLDPRWRGRVVAVLDPNARSSTESWRTPWAVLGESWFDRFIRESEPTLLPHDSTRALVDGLARGKYDLGAFLPRAANAELERLGEAGVPVVKLSRTLAEGQLLELRGAIAVLDGAPHPKAAQLFLNWYLSREGQTAYQTLVDSEDPSRSLRTDIPQGKLADDDWAIADDEHAVANIRTDPELEYAALDASAAFMRSICAEVHCYGY
jgi:iron(III) transport system substrate-binding protein